MRYWIYTLSSRDASVTIHTHTCGRCNDGRGLHNTSQPEGWYGFYATLGAAIDAARSLGETYKEDVCVKGAEDSSPLTFRQPE